MEQNLFQIGRTFDYILIRSCHFPPLKCQTESKMELNFLKVLFVKVLFFLSHKPFADAEDPPLLPKKSASALAIGFFYVKIQVQVG